MPYPITILTKPFPGFKEQIRKYYQTMRSRLRFEEGTHDLNLDEIQSGPQIVENNLIQGLKLGGLPFKYNPLKLQFTSHLGILQYIPDVIQWAIQVKRKKKNFLALGPNVVIAPFDNNRVLCSPEIDLVITPSKWVSDFYLSQAPELQGKIKEWAAGVDSDYWKPTPGSERNRWLIYDKSLSGDEEIRDSILNEFRLRQLPYTLIRYGKYRRSEYLKALTQARGMIVITASESQGLAQFEAWSCDVPTLVWDRHRWEYRDIIYQTPFVSSSPYLNPDCGDHFHCATEFAASFDLFIEKMDTFRPRRYILENHTLIKSAAAYFHLFSDPLK